MISVFRAQREAICFKTRLRDARTISLADSNREAIGRGHTNVRSAIAALRSIDYQGYLSAEVFPRPDSLVAAQSSIDSFRRLMKGL